MALRREFGLNPFQLLSILLIGGSQTGATIKALREAMVVPGSSLTFTLDSLERKGLLRRSRSTADRRQWLLHLTAKGQRFYSSLVERETEAVMPSLEKSSDEERAAFCKIAGEISQAGALQASAEQTHRPCLPTVHRLPKRAREVWRSSIMRPAKG